MNTYISSLYTPLYNPSTNTTTPDIYHPTTPIAVTPNFYYNTGELNTAFNSTPVVDEDDVSRVKLSRDDLLKYTSQEYDDLIKRISHKRPLSEKEHKESKKQRRLIKNREYAQISRNKKKSEYTQLSTQIDQLNQENSQLKQRVDHLETENKRLKEENAILKQYTQTPAALLSISTDPAVLSPPITPSQLSPPLTPTSSSEDSTSFDLFSEDANLFNDWVSGFPSRIPYTFMAVFFCLLLFYPSSMVQPMTSTGQSNYVGEYSRGVEENKVISQSNYNGRHLLTADQTGEKDQLYGDRNESIPSPRTFITMEDVLNDEMKMAQTAVEDMANLTSSFSLLCNHSISIAY